MALGLEAYFMPKCYGTGKPGEGLTPIYRVYKVVVLVVYY